jgi:alpha-N-arabinofuranosidase
MLTANVGSGTAAEAAAWVEYCNAPADTGRGRQRAANGHPGPHQVKYWFIGNEIFGWHEIGWQTPEVYVGTLHDYAKAMRAVDPTIKLIAVGGANPNGGGLDGANQTVLGGAGDIIDYLSIHQYVPAADSRVALLYHIAHLETTNSESVYYDILSTINHMTAFVEHNCRETRTYSPSGKTVPIAFDEWNLWFNFWEDITQNNYNLRDGIWAASMFHLFHRHAPAMPITNIAQMVNCLGIISSDRRGTFLTPTALAFKLYTERAGEALLNSTADGPSVPHESGITALDLSATATGDRVALFLLNRHFKEEMEVTCVIKGRKVEAPARRAVIHHPIAAQYNTIARPEAVTIAESSETLDVSTEAGASIFTVRLAPHSINCLELTAPRT